MHLFSFGKLFCDLFLLLFLLFFNSSKRERGRQGEDAWSVEYETWNCVHKEQRIIINSNTSK